MEGSCFPCSGRFLRNKEIRVSINCISNGGVAVGNLSLSRARIGAIHGALLNSTFRTKLDNRISSVRHMKSFPGASRDHDT